MTAEVDRGDLPEMQVLPRRKKEISVVLLWAAAFMVLLAGLVLSGGTRDRVPPADMAYGWELVLVNRDNSLPEDWEPALMELSNGAQVDRRIYPALQSMFDAMRAENVWPVVRDGWRSDAVQRDLMRQRIEEYRKSGMSYRDAKAEAEKWVAIPGTSEHQLGLAVDINPDTAMSTGDQVYSWLAEHAAEYGFIQRYPPDKVELTGIDNEPWHYRFVGLEAAREIKSMGMCLEEYIQYLKGQ